ncbi:hypothetical protein LB506_009314 [Fusarium annulatum]|nr:hypothetical protein LB506_009314 [Fusarium annulatum]
MSSYLSFQWPNPQGVCCYRSFDNPNDHSIIAIKVPWLQWPNDPLEDVHSPWWVIRDKSLAAVRLWKKILHDKLSSETYHKHMKITSIVLMNEQLRLTIDDLGDGDDHLKLFFGFAADEIANMKEVKGLDLGKDVVKWIGRGLGREAQILSKGPSLFHIHSFNLRMASSEHASALLKWALSQGATLNPSVEVTHLPETGLSFRATAPTAPSDTIVSVPSSLTLSYLDTLPGHGDPNPFPAGFLAQIPPHVVGRFVLIKHFLLKGESFWAPYIQALPQPEDHDSWSLPPFWPDEDAELFEGTNIEVGVTSISANVKGEFKTAHDLLTAESWEPELLKLFTLPLYQWAYSIFSSRSFRPSLVLGPEDQQRLPEGVKLDDFSVLMPLFDVGNHDMTTKVEWIRNERINGCSLKVEKAYQAGEQVFNNYSMKTNAELLLGYGFMLPETEALHNDYVHVRKRQPAKGEATEEYYISLRPIRDPSSLLARSKQTVQLSDSAHILGAFQHVQHDMVWDIFCTLAPPEQRSTLISEGSEQEQQEKFFSGQVSEDGRMFLQQTAAIIQHKVMQELERLLETDVEVVGGGDLTRNQQLALDYRARCRRVLENTLEAMNMEELFGEDDEGDE